MKYWIAAKYASVRSVFNINCFFFFFFPFFRPNDNSHIDPIEMLSVVSEAMKGQQMNLQDKFGQTPLHGAALRGAAICCMYIVEVSQMIFF